MIGELQGTADAVRVRAAVTAAYYTECISLIYRERERERVRVRTHARTLNKSIKQCIFGATKDCFSECFYFPRECTFYPSRGRTILVGGWGRGGGRGVGGVEGGNRWKYTLTPRTDTPPNGNNNTTTPITNLDSVTLKVQLSTHLAHNSRETWGFW